MGELITNLVQSAPQLGLGLLFVVALGLLLKEYRSLRNEVHTSVDDVVNAKLGAILGSIQVEAATATRLLGEISAQDDRMKKLSGEFESRLIQQQSSLEASWNHIRARLGDLEKLVPEASAITSRDLITIAENAPFVEALAMLTKVSEDPDATAKDLEAAGDVARKRRRFALAQRLYERAVKMDPDNNGVRMEALCLSAEMKHDGRNEAIAAAMELATKSMSASHEGRVVNTLIELDRYGEIQQLCERILAKKPPHSSQIYGQALRDLGVAHRHEGRVDLAEELYQEALKARPDDENIMRGYIALLRERKEHEIELQYSQRLLLLDPLDGDYYMYMGRVLTDLGRLDDAIAWFQRAVEMQTTEGRKETARRSMKRLEKRRELSLAFERFGTSGLTNQQLDPTADR